MEGEFVLGLFALPLEVFHSLKGVAGDDVHIVKIEYRSFQLLHALGNLGHGSLFRSLVGGVAQLFHAVSPVVVDVLLSQLRAALERSANIAAGF